MKWCVPIALICPVYDPAYIVMPMSAPDEMNLLRKWTANRDRQALGELIRRHIDFVYATARRQVRDAHLAEDVTQAVFILLLQKAHRIKNEAAMTSWLFTTTRFAAANALKVLRRRRYYENHATQHADHEQTDDESLALLDQAIEHLSRTDQACVVMSFLQQKTHAEVGAAVGISEEAARKRIARAVERLRAFFTSRGAVMSSVAAITSLAAQSKAPAALVESTLNIAVLSQPIAGGSAAGAIAKGVAQMIFTSKLKLAAAACIALLFTGLVTGQVIRHLIAPAIVPVASLQAASPPAASDTVSLGDGETLQLAIAPNPARQDQWRAIDGKSIPSPFKVRSPVMTMRPPGYQALIRLMGAPDAALSPTISPSSNFGSASQTDADGTRDHVMAFSVNAGVTAVDIDVRIADGPWKTFLKTRPAESVQGLGDATIGFTFTPLLQRNGKTFIYVSWVSSSDIPWRLIARETTGEMHVGEGMDGAGSNGVTTSSVAFDVPPELIQSLEFQTRPYRKHVIAKNVALDPATPTTPKVSVEEIAPGK